MNGKIIPMLLLTVLPLAAARKPVVDKREAEIRGLRELLESKRDSLQQEIAARWRARQRAVEQRDTDKEEIGRLSESQEREFNASVSAREEGFSLERQLEEAKKTLDDRRQQVRYVQSVLMDIIEKEADQIAGFFPLDIDSARVRIESIRRLFARNNNSTAAIEQLVDYAIATIRSGTRLSMSTAAVLPDGGEAEPMTVTRFGTVFAYGLSDSGGTFTIGQSGREGADRYRIRKIDNPMLRQKIVAWFGGTAENGWPKGPVSIDIMQSDLSGSLVTGRKETVTERIRRFIKAGGPVMVPLGLLPLWALLLVLLKLLQYIGKRSSIRKTFSITAGMLEKNDREGVLAFIGKRKGSASRAVALCMDSVVTSRQMAESSVKELLYTETARLSSHLNTLAVIAGVAPLLGLLGTVTGMIRLFEVITRFGTGDPKLLAGGISEALITTEVGLIIAVPVLLVHNFLRNYRNRITSELQIGMLRVINRLFPEG
ncbi:MAG: MotA/TolQ/ExbB proton channel family protein [Chitinispirillaceae bacterium]|nr:MotA/TolQ/ExbB proton channel family protein [Chitinispirillaceae bacterium]